MNEVDICICDARELCRSWHKYLKCTVFTRVFIDLLLIFFYISRTFYMLRQINVSNYCHVWCDRFVLWQIRANVFEERVDSIFRVKSLLPEDGGSTFFRSVGTCPPKQRCRRSQHMTSKLKTASYCFVLYCDCFIWSVSCTVTVLTCFVICECVYVCILYVWMCVCGGFVMCGCVCVWMCVCGGFVMCRCVYVWVL